MIYKISQLTIAMLIGYGIAMFNLSIIGFLYNLHSLEFSIATLFITNYYFLYATVYDSHVSCPY